MPKLQKYAKTAEGLSCCPHCDFVGKVSTVSMHVKMKHGGSFKYKCDHCVYEASTSQLLNNHMAAKHPQALEEKPKELQCAHTGCSYTCRTKPQLRSHTLLKHCAETVKTYLAHNEEDEIQCSHCGSAHASKPAFLYHLPKCVAIVVNWSDAQREGLCIN